MKINQVKFWAWTFLFLFVGCSANGETSEPVAVAEAPVSSAGSENVENRQMSFALHSFHAVLDEDSDGKDDVGMENTVCSPFGLYRMLGGLSLGSGGETKQEIEKVMERTGGDVDWIAAMTELYRTLGESDEIRFAGGLWTQNQFETEPAYRETLQKLSAQDVRSVDFSAAGVIGEINDWFREKTEGRVTDLIQEVSPDTRLLLTDAVTFLGEWKHAFDPEQTRDGYFTNLRGEEIRFPMMEQTARYPYYGGDGFQYLEIPYDGDRFVMAVFLPDSYKDYLRWEKDLTADVLEQCHQKAAPQTEINLRFPRFSVEESLDLTAPLQKMGISAAFGGEADFQLISADGDLYLSKVIQGTFLRVDEKGTEAASGTAAGMIPKSASNSDSLIRFYADRPFLYLIRQKENDTVFFLGRFVDPAGMADDAEAGEGVQVLITSEGGGDGSDDLLKTEAESLDNPSEAGIGGIHTVGVGGVIE